MYFLILVFFYMVIGVVVYWLFGYVFVFGVESNGFIGYKYFVLVDLLVDKYFNWFFYFVFVVMVVMIVSGVMVESMEFKVYFVYFVFLIGKVNIEYFSCVFVFWVSWF